MRLRGRGVPVSALAWALALAVSVAAGGSLPMQAQSHTAATGATLASFEFDTSDEGWRIATDSGIGDPRFEPSGGTPGGHISGVDEALGETWYFVAPASAVQQLASAEDGTIRFALKQSTDVDGGFLDDDVVIVGNAGRIGYRFGPGTAPGTAWKNFSVRLSATEGWRWNWSAPATQAQIRSVLASPLSLAIRGEYYTGDDEGSLDNFRLSAAPPPPGRAH